MCCTRLAENTGCKKVAKNHHLIFIRIHSQLTKMSWKTAGGPGILSSNIVRILQWMLREWDTIVSTTQYSLQAKDSVVYLNLSIYNSIKTTSVGDATVSASPEQMLSGRGVRVYPCTYLPMITYRVDVYRSRPIGTSLLTTSPQQGCLALHTGAGWAWWRVSA